MKASRILTLIATVLALTVFQGMALADYSFNLDSPPLYAHGEVGVLVQFHNTLSNTGTTDDTYVVSIVKNAPDDWAATMCEGSTCYPPHITEIEVDLTAGNQTNLDIDLTPLSLGDGSVTITIVSGNNPAQSDTKTFTVVTAGLDVLLVAGDNGMGSDAWYLDAITAAGKTVGTWKRQEMGALGSMDISEFGTVVWESGNVSGGLDSDDLAALVYYIQHGGNLFLSGQNLAFESCDPASPYYSASTKGWFNGILKTDYSYAEGPGDFAAGFEGDIVTGDLFFNLFGGDGANNNLTMDALTAVAGGIATIEYGSGGVAAVRSSYGSGKTFFCGFAFEGIDTEANRNALISQAMLWFDGYITPVGDVVAPLMASIPYATPNPFNPQTNIRFEVGGNQSVQAEVTIYNLKGQAVRNLLQGTVSPGPQNLVWDGRSNDGRALATGIYMARVRLADQSKTVKMTLVK